jgi:Kef-type K+ transport system membrane component KefB
MKLLTHSVLVQIILGAILKSLVPADYQLENFLSYTSLSVVGLFLMVGLQIHPKKFANDFSICALLVIVTTIVPMIFFYGISFCFGLTVIESLTVSVVLVTTGTGVTIQTLSNLGMLHSRVGQFLTLVSAMDDVPAAFFMMFLLMNAPASGVTSTPSVLPFIIGALVFLVSSFWINNKWGLSFFFILFAICFSKALEVFHISLVIGGLFSGFVLSFIFKERVEVTGAVIEKILKPILPFYMIFIGMKLCPGLLKDSKILIFSLVLTITAILTKWISTYLILRKREDLSPKIMAWGMVPRGIPGFAFASIAVSHGLISQLLFTVLILIVSASTWIGLFGLELGLRKERG